MLNILALLLPLILLMGCKGIRKDILFGLLIFLAIISLISRVENSKVLVKKGEFDDIYKEYFDRFLNNMRKTLPENDWQITGSSALYLASPFYNHSKSSDYRFLNTNLYFDDKVIRKYRDIDILVKTEETFDKVSQIIGEVFKGLDIQIKSDAINSHLVNWGIVKGMSRKFSNFVISLDKDPRVIRIMKKFKITDVPKIIIDNSLKITDFPNIHLRRNISASFKNNKLVFSFTFNDPENYPYLSYTSKDNLMSFIESICELSWRLKNKELPSRFTDSGDRLIDNRPNIETNKKVTNFLKTNDVISAIKWIFQGNDHIFIDIININDKIKDSNVDCCKCFQKIKSCDRRVSLACGDVLHTRCLLEVIKPFYVSFYKNAKLNPSTSLESSCYCPKCNSQISYIKGYFDGIDVILEEQYHPFWK